MDEIISDQLDAVLRHPDFRALEASWRGLKLLVDRIDFRTNVQLDVLPVGKDELSEALYHQVLLPEHQENSERPPLSAIILDISFDHGQADIELLEDLAGSGASLQVPIIGSADVSFFGVADLAGLNRLPPLRQHLDGPQYIGWNKLREKEEAKYLALVLPPILLRASYGAENPVDGFAFEETGQLWGGGSLAVAIIMADSYKRSGWPTHLYGNGENNIGGLPLWMGSGAAIPLGALLPEHKQAELSEAGFVVLGCRINRDSAYIAHAPTVRRVGTYETAEAADEERAHFSLACQLFVTRAAQFLLSFQRDIERGASIGQVQSDLSSRLRSLLSGSGHDVPEGAVSIEHLSEVQLPEHEVLEVRLSPPLAILDNSVRLVMHLTVRK
jgi:type VI secretion system protein ImpC